MKNHIILSAVCPELDNRIELLPSCNQMVLGRLRRGRQFGHDGLHQVRGGGAGFGDLRFQLVHQGHQLIHLGHDPALFGEGGSAIGMLFIFA